ncbi:MAG: PAS domain S-box protein [Armatimonadota bacterium]|nr:PAS domain S-box protein [bacterium]
MDYLLFCCALASMLLLAVCLFIRSSSRQSLPWGWLGLYGAVHGFYYLLIVPGYALGHTLISVKVLPDILVLSYLFLAEFSRRCSNSGRQGKHFDWVIAPAFALLAVGALSMWPIVGLTAGHIIYLIAGAWSAFAFRRASLQSRGREKGYLLLAGILLGASAVLSGIAAPSAARLNASLSDFSANIGAIRLWLLAFSGLLTLAAACALWGYAQFRHMHGHCCKCQLRPRAGLNEAIIILVIAILGWVATAVVTNQADSRMREELLVRTATAAASIEHQRIAELTGTLADKKRQDFKEVCAQLRAICAGNEDYGDAYLMELRGGKVIFMADAESLTAKDAPAPGQPYPEASTALRAALINGKPLVEGPLADSWGCWVSALVPIKKHYNQQVMALLGVDIDARDWGHSIAQCRLYAMLIVLIIVILATAVMLNQRSRDESAARVSTSEHRYRALFEGSPNAVCMFDAQGMFIGVNAAGKAGFGRNESELLGTRYVDLWPEETQPLVQQACEDVLQGNVRTFEAEMIRPDGKQVIWKVVLQPIPNASGRVCNFSSIATDFTDLRRSEKELRESEEKHRNLVERANDGIAIIQDHRIKYVNPHGEEMFGYINGEWYNKPIADFCRSEDAQQLMADYKRRITGKITASTKEAVLRHKNGEKVYTELNSALIHYMGKRGVLVVVRDISERKHAEEQLSEAHAQTELVLASMTAALISLNKNGTIGMWNPAAEKAFGVSADRAHGASIRNIGIKWDWDSVSAALEKCNSTGVQVRLDRVAFKRTDGLDGFLSIVVNPMNSNKNAQTGLLMMCVDVTEQLHMETELEQARKMEAIGQIAAGIAHEINTPTQYVIGNLSFLQEGFSDVFAVTSECERLIHETSDGSLDQQAVTGLQSAMAKSDIEYLSQEIPKAIKQSCEGMEHVARIVGAMREFSHPGTEEKRPIDVNKVIESAVTVAQNECKYVADVEMDLSPDIEVIHGPRGPLNQTILNIIVNAAHAIGDVVGERPSVKGKITLKTCPIEDGVEIRINDTGTGIKEEIRSKIFNPFFTTKDVGRGTGQGLAIAYSSVVDKLGGTITFETEVGCGTTFIIRLPSSGCMREETAEAA